MDITKDNFDASIEIVKAAIDSAEFISFDTELTGTVHVVPACETDR